jgi:hypothetical protein
MSVVSLCGTFPNEKRYIHIPEGLPSTVLLTDAKGGIDARVQLGLGAPKSPGTIPRPEEHKLPMECPRPAKPIPSILSNFLTE